MRALTLDMCSICIRKELNTLMNIGIAFSPSTLNLAHTLTWRLTRSHTYMKARPLQLLEDTPFTRASTHTRAYKDTHTHTYISKYTNTHTRTLTSQQQSSHSFCQRRAWITCGHRKGMDYNRISLGKKTHTHTHQHTTKSQTHTKKRKLKQTN